MRNFGIKKRLCKIAQKCSIRNKRGNTSKEKTKGEMNYERSNEKENKQGIEQSMV